MADLPKKVDIREEGPREGFQIEKNLIPTGRKVEFINALAQTGLHHIQTVSFVDPRRVPGMADAEAVAAGITLEPGVRYTGLWLNDQGFARALATKRLTVVGSLAFRLQRFPEAQSEPDDRRADRVAPRQHREL